MKKIPFLLVMCMGLLFSTSLWANTEKLKYEPCDANKYQSNMTFIAKVLLDGNVLVDCQVGVFDENGECRGANASSIEDDGLVYLTVVGEGNTTQLHFKVSYTDETGEKEELAQETLEFSSDAMKGTFEEPYLITIGKTDVGFSSIQNPAMMVISRPGGLYIQCDVPTQVQVSSLLGITDQYKVEGNLWIPLSRGVYIVNGKKYKVTQ